MKKYNMFESIAISLYFLCTFGGTTYGTIKYGVHKGLIPWLIVGACVGTLLAKLLMQIPRIKEKIKRISPDMVYEADAILIIWGCILSLMFSILPYNIIPSMISIPAMFVASFALTFLLVRFFAFLLSKTYRNGYTG